MLLAAAAMAGAALPRTNGAVSWQRREAAWERAWFICDGIDRPAIHVVGAPEAGSRLTVWSYAKAGFRTTRTRYVFGRDDPGMSQLNTPLYASADSTALAGSFTSFVPAVLPDPASATTGTFTSLRLDAQATRCRWLPNTRIMLFTPKRSVVVTREGGRYVYRSFDYGSRLRVEATGWSTTPSLILKGGRSLRPAAGASAYTFANGTTVYRVSASNDPRAPGATLTVRRRGRTLLTETAAGYTVAR